MSPFCTALAAMLAAASLVPHSGTTPTYSLLRDGGPASPLKGAPATPVTPRPRSAHFSVDCRAAGHPISPGIYGIGGVSAAPEQWAASPSGRRWGGNASTRFNWELGNAWNSCSDWFFRNVPVRDQAGFSVQTWIDENRAHGVKSALTIPMLGWVAKDVRSFSFPRSLFPRQQSFDPDVPDAGNGKTLDGKPAPPGPPTLTSAPSTPESIERWVRALRARAGDRTPVEQYILDNEPMLWHETHRDVHPDPATYDELLAKTVAYASAIRRADPQAIIAGPAAWGWLEYHYSARDVASGLLLRLDRRAHADVPLIPWYLTKLREHRERTGTRLIDVLDVHFYPANPVICGADGGTTPAVAAQRIRATRSLWDPSYRDESWIGERMRVLPMLREWVDKNDPGLGISIGEWNFGAERHMSGGLATAEALGRFGTEGLTSAFYWTFPPEGSPAFWAFRAFRNFDGAGAHFLDWSVPVRSEERLASMFASRDAAETTLVAILLNFDPSLALTADIDLLDCGRTTSVRAFRYTGAAAGLEPVEVAPPSGPLHMSVAPYSITVLELGLARPGATTP